MTCPTIERLLEVFVDGVQDAEVETHVANCPECSAYVTLFEELPAVFEPDITVPEALLERTAAALAALPEPLEETSSVGLFLATLLSGVLGWVTTLCILIGAGAAGSGTPIQLLLTSVSVGAGTMAWKATKGWGEGSRTMVTAGTGPPR